MAEYIEREALMKKLLSYAGMLPDFAKYLIEHFPAADVAPVAHGRWKYICGDEFSETYKCDKCGREFDICVELFRETLPAYCPSCGVKMDGGGKT